MEETNARKTLMLNRRKLVLVSRVIISLLSKYDYSSLSKKESDLRCSRTTITSFEISIPERSDYFLLRKQFLMKLTE